MDTLPQPIPLRIDIVSDVVCPWCIIGYRQLLRALEQLPGEFDVSVHWQPFELNPKMPPSGQLLREHVAQKYGSSAAQSQASRSRLTEMGESVGFTFDYHEGMYIYNTFLAHQLLHWAGEQHRQTELSMVLFEAFFRLGENISDIGVLAAAAVRAGLPRDEAVKVLEDGRYADAVRQQQQLWAERDIHAVPTFFMNERYWVPGAQDAATFVRVLKKLREQQAA